MQTWWVLVSSFELTNGTINTPLLLFYLERGLEGTTVYCIVEYTPVQFFKNFEQCVFNARRQGDENPNSSLVA